MKFSSISSNLAVLDTMGYKELVSFFITITYLVEYYIKYRQHVVLSYNKVPSKAKKYLDQGNYEESRKYALTKSSFGFVKDFISFFQDLLICYFNVYSIVWSYCGVFINKLGFSNSEYLHSILFVICCLLSSVIIETPFSYYYHFVIEAKFGFNKQTPKLFFIDILKSIALTFVLASILIPCIIYFTYLGGDNFALYLWAFVAIFSLLMVHIYPNFIQPLFNKFTPLEDGELKTEIEKLAASLRFPLDQIFIIDGSIRSSHSNAYFTGIFSKRIVLFDTLITDHTTEEIVAILAHELGHWKKRHILFNLLFAQAHMFIIFQLFSYFIHDDALYSAFGFYESKAVIIGFILFNQILSPTEFFLNFFLKHISRLFEYQADRFACELGYSKDLNSALTKLSRKNKGEVYSDPLYSAYTHTHPPVYQRVEAMEQFETSKDKKKE